MSHKEFERVTTVFIHDCSGKEKQHILDRLEDAALKTLTVHPLLIITIVMELLHNKMWEDVELMYQSSLTTILEAEEFNKGTGKEMDTRPESIRTLRLGHSASVHLWRMQQLRDFAECLKGWIADFNALEAAQDQIPFAATRQILLDHVHYLKDSLREAHIQLEQADRYVQIYRQWVSCIA